MEYDLRRVAVRLVIVVGIAAGLLYGVGWERVLANLRTADLRPFVAACVVSVGAMLAGGEGVRLALDLPVRGNAASTARRAYLAASFIRSFIPAGNVGGSAFVAYAVSRENKNVSRSIAGVAGWEFLNMVASAVVATAGVVGVATGGGGTGSTPVVVAAFAALLVIVGGAIMFVADRRDWVTDRVLGVARVGRRVLPVETETLSREHVRSVLDDFFDAVEALVADRVRLTFTLVAAHVGWMLGCLVVYFCLLAVSLPVSVSVVLLAVPLAGFASAVPIPGGVGPVDAALGGVVAVFSGYELAAIASALVLNRAATYGVHIVVGGTALWTLERPADDW